MDWNEKVRIQQLNEILCSNFPVGRIFLVISGISKEDSGNLNILLAVGSKIRWPILSRLTCISRLPFRFYDLTPARSVPFFLLLFETLYVGLDGFWFSFG